MKAHFALSAMFLIVGCTSTEQRLHTEIMDAIEHGVQIPSEAGPLSQFARAYRYASSTSVVAFYFIPDEKIDARSCNSAKASGPNNGKILLHCPPPDGIKAGGRRWLDDDVSLPYVNDGGCNYIDIEYDLISRAVTLAECHGEA